MGDEPLVSFATRAAEMRDRALGRRLIEDGHLTEESLRRAEERKAATDSSFPEVLVALGFVPAQALGPYLEETTGFPFVDISDTEFDRNIATLVPESVATARLVLPFRDDEDRVCVAMADPLDLGACDELRALLGRPIVPYLALPGDLGDAIRRTFDVRQRTRALLEDISVAQAQIEDQKNPAAEVEEAPIARLVSSVVLGAVAAGASDVHIEPHEESVQVRYRIDGLLYDQMTIPMPHLNATMSRLKIVSGLDISERRRPQDGRFSTRDESGAEYDVRLSLMPTVYGEKACMRILQKSGSVGSLERLGFFPEQHQQFNRFVARPHGLVLVTGPTGSGKSTTLYAALQSINERTRNINTVEDPVEYRLPGINQVQVNPKIGLTFATGLRTLVRQDPDVILVGEIRDRETAEISVQAALTGHLVLSTLHTNDAPGALVRLQNMGVEPFLIASAMVGVVGQRLLRNICPHCRTTDTLTQEMAESLGLPILDGQPPTIARGAGCKRCSGRGTRGRAAAYELMSMSDALRDLVLGGASGAELYQRAVDDGMVTMRESALRKVVDCTISPEEVMRVFAHAD